MSPQLQRQLPRLAAVVLVFLVVAACAVRLRSGEEPPKVPASMGATADPLATKLAECRSVTYEQKDALSECRKAWVEKRHQFLGDTGSPQESSSLFVQPKDGSRLPSSLPQASGQE